MADGATGNCVRVGFIGAGAISADHAMTLKHIGGVKLVAVCDLFPERARRLAEQFGNPQVFSSAEAMLKAVDLDAVHVLTPPQFHFDAASAALQAGRHVLVEKPLALSSTDCARLEAHCAKTGTVCAVNHSIAHHPIIERLVQTIRKRKLGALRHVSVHFCAPPDYVPIADPGNYMFQSPENMMFEFGPHPMSLVRLLMGGVIDGETVVSDERLLAGGRRYFASWQSMFVCARGTASVYLGIGTSLRQASLRVIGEDGTVEADLVRGTLHLFGSSPRPVTGPVMEGAGHALASLSGVTARVFHRYTAALNSPMAHRRDVFYRSIEAFYSARASGRGVREDFAAGRAVVEYCEAAVRNTRLGAPVEDRAHGAA